MAAKTIIGTENTSFTPTILAARNEMRSWRILALDPAAMRRPDHTTQPPGIPATGAYIPATLQHLAHAAAQDNPEYDVYGQVSSRLSELVPVQRGERGRRQAAPQQLILEIVEHSGLKLQANSISDGTAVPGLGGAVQNCRRKYSPLHGRAGKRHPSGKTQRHEPIAPRCSSRSKGSRRSRQPIATSDRGNSFTVFHSTSKQKRFSPGRKFSDEKPCREYYLPSQMLSLTRFLA
nr:hypothetical protein [Candidatus Synechococcus spongiarum]